jgi:hypothetical protein
MSVKAQGLVWDLECPKQYGELMFKPSHKYVLIAYADHADHLGHNIWPAVPTIARKTGLDERSVQRLTHDLEAIGLLVEDGQGPRGTNKWRLPYSEGGDKLSPVAICQGDKTKDSLGDIPSGDIPSGDKLTPEVKEPEPLLTDSDGLNQKIWQRVIDQLQDEMPRGSFQEYVSVTRANRYDGNTLVVVAPTQEIRLWLDDRVRSSAERLLVGILREEVNLEFVVME